MIERLIRPFIMIFLMRSMSTGNEESTEFIVAARKEIKVVRHLVCMIAKKLTHERPF